MSIPLMQWQKDVRLGADAPKKLELALHAAFVKGYDSEEEKSLDQLMSESLRMNGVYWCLTAMDLMDRLGDMEAEKIAAWVMEQRHESGGFRAAPGHDPHLLHTLSAVQVMVLLRREAELDPDSIAAFVAKHQQEDGSFVGDEWGEVDSRFSFCALATLKLLARMKAVNVSAALDWILRCWNADGGFGTRPGSESHAGQIYCCLGSLSLCGALERLGGQRERLGAWLAARQLPSGGLNGRPEKLPDVCYSWWVLASLAILGLRRWISAESLEAFILASQDVEGGGFSDRPGDLCDPFHTVFGLAGLSLLGRQGLPEINPVLCMPQRSLQRLNLRIQIIPERLI